MTQESKDYESNIIAKAINSKIDLILGVRSDEKKLELLKINLDDIVYDTAKKIFQEVGVKVDFDEIRDCILSRSRNLSRKLEEQIKFQKEQKIEEEKRLEFLTSTLGTSKLKLIISEQLSVEEERVTLKADFRNDLNADDLGAVELIMAIEEAFDIEIPDEAAEGIRNLEELIGYMVHKSSTNKR